jgi:hypothetical protein
MTSSQLRPLGRDIANSRTVTASEVKTKDLPTTMIERGASLGRCILFLYAAAKFLASHSSRYPVSVNYHFTRQWNKSCGSCFHAAITTHQEQLTQAQRALRLRKEAGMWKISFAEGEPILHSGFLSSLIDYCKNELEHGSVSIVTNESLVAENLLCKRGQNIDILAV